MYFGRVTSYAVIMAETASNLTVGGRVAGALRAMRPLFYLEPPSQSSFEKTSEVPDYLAKAVPYFLLFIMLEVAIRWLQGKRLPRVNDAVSSLTAGLVMTLIKLLVGAIELISYAWVYEKFRLVSLPWDLAITWWAALVGVDFFYYWFHRMAHEVNLFWAAHQVHHSSEEYNLSTALRQSAMQRFTSWFFYLPMALAIPPAAYIVHKQFNLLYQFWIHTEVIDRLGPLEWILNTPSHHRVHHGRNRYCIDKNYAGVFIVWDRMFGTFEAERGRIIYGLVHPLSSWNPLWAQLHHFVYIGERLLYMEGGLGARVSFLFKGPGWSPGKPRLGCVEDIPEVPVDDKPYNPSVAAWVSVYCVLHFALVLYSSQILDKYKLMLPYLVVVGVICFLLWSLTNFGLMFDRHWACPGLEAARLAVILLLDHLLCADYTGVHSGAVWVVRVVSVASLCLWIVVSLKHFINKNKRKVY